MAHLTRIRFQPFLDAGAQRRLTLSGRSQRRLERRGGVARFSLFEQDTAEGVEVVGAMRRA